MVKNTYSVSYYYDETAINRYGERVVINHWSNIKNFEEDEEGALEFIEKTKNKKDIIIKELKLIKKSVIDFM